MSSINPKQRLIYSALLIIGLAYIAYILIISTNIQKINTLKSDCDSLSNELMTLENYVVNRERYLKQINENNDKIASTVDTFLPEIKNQDFIAYAQYLDDEFSMSTNVFAFDDESVTTELAYIFDSNREETFLIDRAASLTYSIKYNDLKSYFERLKESDMNIYITNMTASLDSSTNLLTGNITLNSRAISSSLKTDEMFDVDNIHTGVDNIFGEYNENISQNNSNSSSYDVVDTQNSNIQNNRNIAEQANNSINNIVNERGNTEVYEINNDNTEEDNENEDENTTEENNDN